MANPVTPAVYGDNQVYYRLTRSDIEPLLPAVYERVLEVGCARGNTLRWLGDRVPGAVTIGIELNEGLAEELRRNVSSVYIGDASYPPTDLQDVDLMLFLDVLEHFSEPATILGRYLKHLSPGGTVIVSLPNIAHFKVSIPLLFMRKFEYADAGILDRTHLHFFTAESAIAMFSDCGLIVEECIMSGPGEGKSRLVDRLTGGVFSHYLARQYLFKVRKTNGISPVRPRWLKA